MPNIDVEVNKRDYAVACEPGQENHVRDLARYFDAQIQNLKKSGVKRSGVKTADINYMVLASLILADELTEARNRIDQLEDELERRARTLSRGGNGSDDERVTHVLETIADRLETVAAGLEAA